MSWYSRLKNLVDSPRLQKDLAEEVQGHLDRRAEALMRGGVSRSEAYRQARVAFGRLGTFQEESRRAKAAVWLEAIWQDMSYARRALVRRPGSVVTAVLSIGLAVAVAAAVYGTLSATLLRPLPVPEPDRLVALSVDEDGLFSVPLFETLRRAAGDAARLILLDDPHRADVHDERADGVFEQATSQFVSPDMFAVLGVTPAAGLLFSDEDARLPPTRAGIVLSYDFWTRHFGANADAVGRRLDVDGRSCTVLGVAARGFRGVEPGSDVDIWRPIAAFDPAVFTNPAFRSFRVMGRLGLEASAASLASRLEPAFRAHQRLRIETEASRLPLAEQETMRNSVLHVSSAGSGVSLLRTALGQPLWVLMALAALILCLACVNVAGLATTDARGRTRDIAIRFILGADRSRVFRQFVIEGVIIGTSGVVIGMTLGRALATMLATRLSTGTVPVRLDFSFDRGTLAFGIATTVLVSLIVGVWPAWSLSREAQHGSHTRTSRLGGRVRSARLVVGFQVAVAFTLVMTGTAFLISLRHLTGVDVGFDARDVTVFTVANDLGPAQWPLQTQMMQDLQARVGAAPHVGSVAAAWWAMFSGARRAQRVSTPGGMLSDREEVFYRVSPNYFHTMRIAIRRGRDFTAADNDTEPVASLVNIAFAQRYLGGDAALGRVFLRDDGVRHVVVGVVADSRYDAIRGGAEPIVYMPMKPPRVFTLYVRSSLPQAAISAIVGRETAALGHGARVRDVHTMQGLIDDTIVTERVLAGVGAVCGALGLTLAMLGLFGLLGRVVSDRTPEIGLRAALGARKPAIWALVAVEAVQPVLAGLVCGMAAALLLVNWSHGLLYGVRPVDPVVGGVAMGAFLTAALIGATIPAARAASLDPLTAIRRD